MKEFYTTEEVTISLGKDNIQVILEEMIEAVALGLDQVKELALTEIGLDVLNVGNIIISLRNVQLCKQKKSKMLYKVVLVYLYHIT